VSRLPRCWLNILSHRAAPQMCWQEKVGRTHRRWHCSPVRRRHRRGTARGGVLSPLRPEAGAQILFPLAERGSNTPDLAQYGVAENLYATPVFWLVCALTALVSFGHRYIERGAVWLFRPQARPPPRPGGD